MSLIAVAALEELSDTPLGVEVPGTDIELALVRIADEVFAIYDECSHGKVRLSEGETVVSVASVEDAGNGDKDEDEPEDENGGGGAPQEST